jgi:hypothetical protein
MYHDSFQRVEQNTASTHSGQTVGNSHRCITQPQINHTRRYLKSVVISSDVFPILRRTRTRVRLRFRSVMLNAPSCQYTLE